MAQSPNEHESGDRFIIPRPLRSGEKPRSSISETGLAARVAVSLEGFRHTEPAEASRHTPLLSVISEWGNRAATDAVAAAAAKEGRDPLWRDLERAFLTDRSRATAPTDIGRPDPPIGSIPKDLIPGFPWPPTREPTMERLQRLLDDWINRGIGCYPDLDEVTPFSVCPGRFVQLRGTCFGDTPGQVLYNIAPNNQIVDLEILSWSQTEIEATLATDISGLRPFDGRMWMIDASGRQSNDFPVSFRPMLVLHFATMGIQVRAGLLGFPGPGDPDTSIALDGQTLDDADFDIERTESTHTGEGWSELRAPHASGQSLSQGWHMGLASRETGTIQILYRLKGPRGIQPPTIARLSPWGMLGEVGCD